MPTLTTSDTSAYIRAIIFGPPGHLKTASSVTMSAKCPPDWTHLRLTLDTIPKRAPASLDDMLWIGFDSQALLGFKQLGVSAPLIDLSATPPGQLLTELPATVKLVAERVAKKLTTTVVIDTVSALDEMITVAQRDKGLDKFDLYREILISHLRFAARLKELPCNILFLCHAKAVLDQGSDSDSGRKQAENMAKKQVAGGTGSIIPAITGAALNHYRRDVSLIFSVSKGVQTDAVTKKPVDGFWFHSRHKEFDTKSRLLLPDSMPANWRIVRQYLTPTTDVVHSTV